MRSTGLILLFILFVCGCTSNRYEDGAWEVAETSATNGEELSRFLEHYKDGGDREKYEAACFLVCNMPGKYSVTGGRPVYDVDVVKADSLVRSLEASFALRGSSPYLKDYSFGQFLEYILPYRVANEPLEYGWKEDCPNRFAPEKGMGIKEAADAVNAQVRLDLSPASYGDLPQSYSSLMKNGFGKCDDRTALLVMALRAAGIPSAYEFVPQWGSSNNGHSFVSVILPDGSVYPLQNTDKATGDGYLSRKPTKIYRKMYELQGGGPSGNDSSIPELFRYGDLLDVTSLHRVGSRDVEINAKGNGRKGGLYLAAFLPGGWNPVAESHTGLFKDVSTGTRLDMPKESEAEGLGDGVVYLPVRWNSGRAEAAGNPVIVSDSAVREIIPDTAVRETVRLLRKYPLNARIVSFAKLMVMGRFEGANRADFSDAETVYRILDTPECRMQRVVPDTDKAFRYVRYIRPKGTFSIAELALYRPDGSPIPFRPVVCEALSEDSLADNVFDSDPLTYYQTGGGIELWAGADMGRPTAVGSIGFAPRNDDNAVNSRDSYELFWWDGGWKSLGVRTASSDTLVYENVPEHALLWLRDLTRGREERPFTYENGRQVWW